MKRAAIFFTLLLPVCLLLGFGYVVNGRIHAKPQMIDVGGSISTDTIWTAANSPYILTDTVTVEAGVTLTVEAGVTVMVPDMGEYLDIQGHLEAVGTAVNPILFTSIDDLSTNNWSGIAVLGSANLTNVTLRYAWTALFISDSAGGNIVLEDSIFEENLVYPIIVNTDALHRLEMNNVNFINNIPDRVGINKSNGIVDILTLAGNVLLTPQPGLEGYEDLGNGSTPQIIVPQGISLTFAAGTTFMSESSVIVDGHIEASGTVTEPVILDDRPDGGNSMVNYFVVGGTGSASLSHTIIRDGNSLGLGIGGQSDLPVILQDVVLENVGEYPIIVEAPSLHRLQMTNVTFQNNVFNRVFVDTDGGQEAIAEDVILTSQPGLEWYEFADGSDQQTWPLEFVVPEGVTLTVEPGVEMRFGDGAENFIVNGRLQAIGSSAQPITFTSAADSAPGEWEGLWLQGGDSQLEHVVVRNGRESILIGELDVNATVQISDSTIRSSSQTPLGIQTGSLHQTQLNSLEFSNNIDGNNIVLYGEPTLSGDATLTNQPGLDAYIILNNSGTMNWFVVPDPFTLSIQSGITFKFASNDFGLMVEGSLHTFGTPSEPVIMTSLADSAPGEWQGITLEGGSVQLSNTIVRYGEEALIVDSLDADDVVQLEDSYLQNNLRAPIGIKANNLHQLSLANVTFANNQDGDYIVIYEDGNIVDDVTLTMQPGLEGYLVLNSPTSQLVVPQDVNLTLMDGVNLKFNESNQELVVNGHLSAMGTMISPVTITSFADSAPNQWGGIMVDNGSLHLQYTDVRYGEYNIVVNNTAVSNSATIENSNIHNAAMAGLWPIDGTVTAVCSSFNNNGVGVLVWETGTPSLSISSSSFAGNADFGLLNNNSVQVDAKNNWWGDETGPAGTGLGNGMPFRGMCFFHLG